jgi:hypothetical protein
MRIIAQLSSRTPARRLHELGSLAETTSADDRPGGREPRKWLWACQDLNLGPHPYQAHSLDAFKLLERETTSSSRSWS